MTNTPTTTQADALGWIPGAGGDLVVDPQAADGILRFRVTGDNFPRVSIDVRHGILATGDGTAPPIPLSSGGIDFAADIQAAIDQSLASGEAYADAQDAITLAAAKAYTDAAIIAAFAGAAATVPVAPTIGTTTPGAAQGSVAFTPGADGGNTILDYTATCTPVGGGVPHTATGASSPVVVTGLTPGTSYTSTVTARNGIGSSVASAASASFLVPAVVPGAPSLVSGVAGDAQAIISFSAPASNGGSAITGYTVTATSSDGGTTRTASGASSPITVTALTNTKHYTVTVHATNVVGNSAESVASATLAPVAGGGGIAPPQALSVLVANEHIFGSFAAPASGTVTAYTISVAGQTIAPMTLIPTGQAREKFILEGLSMQVDGGADVSVSITATTSGGTSAPVSTTALSVVKMSPLQTFTVDGDRISGIWQHATVRAFGIDFAIGVLAAYTGPATFADNTPIVGKILTGNFRVANGVRARLIGCKGRVPTGDGNNYVLDNTASTGSFDLRYCEGDGTNGDPAGTDEYGAVAPVGQGLVRFSGWTAECCYGHHMVHTFYASGSGESLKWSAQDISTARTGEHNGAFFIDSGDSILDRGNHLAVGQGQTTSHCWAPFGPGTALSNLTARDNWPDGGGYAVYYGATGGRTCTNETIQRNRWLRAYQVVGAVTIPAGSFTLTVNRPTTPAQGQPIPSAGTLRLGFDDGTWGTATYTGRSGNTFTGVTCTVGVGKTLTASVSTAGVQLQGTVRVIDTPTGQCMSGRWVRSGYFGPATATTNPAGTFVHDTNVWDDDGTPVNASLN